MNSKSCVIHSLFAIMKQSSRVWRLSGASGAVVQWSGAVGAVQCMQWCGAVHWCSVWCRGVPWRSGAVLCHGAEQWSGLCSDVVEQYMQWSSAVQCSAPQCCSVLCNSVVQWCGVVRGAVEQCRVMEQSSGAVYAVV